MPKGVRIFEGSGQTSASENLTNNSGERHRTGISPRIVRDLARRTGVGASLARISTHPTCFRARAGSEGRRSRRRPVQHHPGGPLPQARGSSAGGPDEEHLDLSPGHHERILPSQPNRLARMSSTMLRGLTAVAPVGKPPSVCVCVCLCVSVCPRG